MRKLLILGAGTAGTMLANRLRKALAPDDWSITIIDQEPVHYYQPGFLFIPFGTYSPEDVVKPKARFIPDNVDFIIDEIDLVDPEENRVYFTGERAPITYDYLIIATGTSPRPDETPGLLGPEWRKTIHDFYTFEGTTTLANTLRDWKGGKLVLNVVEMPIKCPVAPLEFLFLADDYFSKRGMREDVELTLVTPLSGAFTKPKCNDTLSSMLVEKNIHIIPDFNTERVESDQKLLISFGEDEVPYDLLVTVPVNMGADFIERSGLGDELNHVPVDKHTFLSTQHDNIFAIGDASNVPTSKAGSVAHFAAELFVDNFLRHVSGRQMEPTFDGHANCFIESGHGKAVLVDFNYDVEPLPGSYPYAGIGPFNLLQESRINHLGKMAFRWLYWNMLLKGRNLPVPVTMSMKGKIISEN